jgi:uncharacterized protein (TIRG00374 family)
VRPAVLIAASPAQERGRWSWVAAITLATILLYFSLRGVDWTRVWQDIAGAGWRFLAGAGGVLCLGLAVRSLRWRLLLNAEAHCSVGEVFAATVAGYLGNNFLPARAGELVRTLVICGRSPLSKTYVLTTALSERLVDAITLVLWSSVILLEIGRKPQWMEDLSRATAIAAAVGAVALAILPNTERLWRKLLHRLPLPSAVRERLLRITGQALLGVRAFHNPGRFLGFAGLTVVIWLLDASGTMIAARAFGMRLSFPVAMLLVTGLGLGSALPSTPGYVGIYQFVAVTVLTPFGVNRDTAVAFILAVQALQYVVLLALGLPALYWIQAAAGGLAGLWPFPGLSQPKRASLKD